MGMQSFGSAPARNASRAANAGGGVKPGEIAVPGKEKSIGLGMGRAPQKPGAEAAGFNSSSLKPGKLKV